MFISINVKKYLTKFIVHLCSNLSKQVIEQNILNLIKGICKYLLLPPVHNALSVNAFTLRSETKQRYLVLATCTQLHIEHRSSTMREEKKDTQIIIKDINCPIHS